LTRKDFQKGELISSPFSRVRHDRRDKTLFISADGTLRYGEVVSVIDAAKGAGVERVGVITESMRAAK
jgi:biopolymer transport protein ExbD